eukprot:TRINITY_DN9879_c0_g1_i7.p2 TRINITY_DN9879_c0_g1~~TRINITY_DN9879_c0_g1_i7.p2  ORF type:complete len:123 (+),score=36.67 TRINITY_DN9879_c0_g1_i7:132-500(+)
MCIRDRYGGVFFEHDACLMEDCDQLKVLTADNLRLQDALDAVSKKLQIASDENSELRAALQCLSSDESLALLDDTSEQTLAFKLKVQLVDILPQPDHQIQRTPVLLAVLFEVTALVLCMVPS